MRTIVLLGAPGAGKGTQAKFIHEYLSIPHISTGATFRKHMVLQTELGILANKYISKGNLVPDDVTNRIVAERLGEPDCANGFLLDGYPRNLGQADALATTLDELGYQLDGCIDINIAEEVIIERLLKRAEIEGRADDTREVITHRIEVYHQQTAPLLNYYRERDKLVTVDGNGTIEEVWERIKPLLSA